MALAALFCIAGALTLRPAAARAATPPARASSASSSDNGLTVEDPLQGVNRRAYAVHNAIDHAILRPVAMAYQHHVPKFLRTALHNLVVELSEPVVFGNDVLQLRIARAGRTAARFLANATVGVGGLMDPATKWGLPHHDNGFGDTLGHYGITPGPYLFIPLLGPSNFRDLIGEAVDFYSDPISLIHYPNRGDVQSGIWIIGGIDERANAEADLEQIDEMGTDTYATMRSLYMQDRESEIHGGQLNIQNLPNFDDTTISPVPASPTAPGSSSAPAPAATDPSASAPSLAVVASAPPDTAPDAAGLLAHPSRFRPAHAGPRPRL